MIAANIDTAFIVQSCHYDFNLHRLDRYLVMAGDGGIEPVLVLTKTDLVTPEELEKTVAVIRQAGITARILALSNATGAGLDDFRQLLAPGKTYCLLGSSGVGKTTLINRLIGREAFATQATSRDGGRHAHDLAPPADRPRTGGAAGRHAGDEGAGHPGSGRGAGRQFRGDSRPRPQLPLCRLQPYRGTGLRRAGGDRARRTGPRTAMRTISS